MTVLLPEQAEALRELQGVCRDLGTEVVVVGAIALRAWIPDEYRLTEDVDVVVGLDLDEFESLATRLTALGWHPDARWEPRWHSRGGARVDLLPIGLRARQEGRIVWPRAETVMRVVGYDDIFRDAITCELSPGFQVGVAPLHVLAFLKVVAYLDAPALREKDLGDLLVILDKYGDDGVRRFSDDVLDAGVQYDEAGAFLLGRDLRALGTAQEKADAVRRFLQRVMDRDFHMPGRLVRARTGDEDDLANRSRRQLAALARGFGGAT
jgi:predicted nucleotidyltransferase